MVIGVPKEIKDHEFRVALTPNGVKELCGRGYRVCVQKSAGVGSGFADQAYREAGGVNYMNISRRKKKLKKMNGKPTKKL